MLSPPTAHEHCPLLITTIDGPQLCPAQRDISAILSGQYAILLAFHLTYVSERRCTHTWMKWGIEDARAVSDKECAFVTLKCKDNIKLPIRRLCCVASPQFRETMPAAISLTTGYRWSCRSRASPAGQRQGPWPCEKSRAPTHLNASRFAASNNGG